MLIKVEQFLVYFLPSLIDQFLFCSLEFEAEIWCNEMDENDSWLKNFWVWGLSNDLIDRGGNKCNFSSIRNPKKLPMEFQNSERIPEISGNSKNRSISNSNNYFPLTVNLINRCIQVSNPLIVTINSSLNWCSMVSMVY
jgi:hypothetical protein